MKKFAVMLLAILMVLSLAACVTVVEDEPTTAPVATEVPTEAPTEAPTEDPTEEPTEAPTEEPTEAPTEEPTEAPTNPPVQPTNPPSKPTEPADPDPEEPADPDEPADPEEDAVIYEGRMNGRQVIITIDSTTGSFSAVESLDASEEELAEMGLTGTLRMSMIRRAAFGKATVTGNEISLSEMIPGMYASIKFEGTAAADFVTMYKQFVEDAYAAGEFTEEEYNMAMAMLNGEESFSEEENTEAVTVVAEVNASKLITSLLLEEADGSNAYLYRMEYNGSVVTKETEFTLSASHDRPHAIVKVYYPDGVTVKTESKYSIRQNDNEEWELNELYWTEEYREDDEYDENGIIFKSTDYDADGNVTGYSDYYDDGTLKKQVWINEDGTENVDEYYDNGNAKSSVSFDEDGTKYVWEFYEGGETKLHAIYHPDGTEDIWEYYENGEYKKVTIYFEDDEFRSHCVIECYENGEYQKETVYYLNGTYAITEYDENGKTIHYGQYNPDGTVIVAYCYTYEYYNDNKIKSVTVTDHNDAFLEKYEYEYHDNGEIKKEIFTDASGNQAITEFFEDGSEKAYTEYKQGKIVYQFEKYENGNDKKYYHYDEAEGYAYAYEYYDDGTMKYESLLSADGIGYEAEYYPNAYQKSHIYHYGNDRDNITLWYDNGNVKYEKVYNNDFSYYIEEYFENGLTKRYESYDAEGNLEGATSHTYEYYEDGSVKKKYNYEDGALTSYAEITYHENGEIKKISNYDANGNPTYVMEYDQDGNPIET